MVQSGDSVCKNDPVNNNEDYGVTYEKLVGLTGGVVGSVCATDYSTQLGTIGAGLEKIVRSVSLDCAPVDANKDGVVDLAVTIDGVSTTAFTVSGSLVTFSSNLKGKVAFTYTCKGN